MRLSVLDQSIAVQGRPHGQAIQDTLALAQHCEGLGYHRFWVSEHHNHPTIVGTAPEILIAAIASRTERIRVGSAGVMLPHYSAFKVAEQFRVLDAIAPGRIDLGLGRAPGSDGRTAFALHPLANQRPEQFPADVRDLDAWVHGEALVENHPFATLKAYPQGRTAPEVWMLGSSLYGAQLAAVLGLPYCFAWFITDGFGCDEALAQYRKSYRPSARWPEPHVALCLWALAADTEEDAQHHFTSRARWKLFRDRGVYGPLESPEAAAAHSYTDKDADILEGLRRDSFVGTGKSVATRIRATAEESGAAEVAIVTWAHDEDVRRRSYELLAQEFGLVAG
ncbi:MAG: LLM class flavin-dependent oxidoreductase [Rhodospirillales bacterium]|nr:MAG: LLM class flavin-dependent oxidoreductase [Rhodospirillales bacterium]